MRSAAAVMVAAVLAMILQTTIFPRLPLLPVVPDLVLVIVTWLGLRHHGVGGVLGAFLLGWYLDTFSGTVLGVQAFGCTAVYAAVYVLARTIWTESGVSTMMVVFVAGCVRAFAIAVVGVLTGDPGPFWHHFVRVGFLEALAAAAVSRAMFGFLDWEQRRVFRVV